jgi:hypothetical protein
MKKENNALLIGFYLHGIAAVVITQIVLLGSFNMDA